MAALRLLFLVASVVSFVAALTACRPELDAHASPGAAGGAPGVALSFEPDADGAAVPPIVHVHVSSPKGDAPPLLFTGDLGAASLREIEAGALSKSLEARVVPSTIWRARDDDVVIAPEAPLEAGPYSVAIASRGLSLRFSVATDHAPVAARVWPLAGTSATNALAIWCAPSELAPFHAALDLGPNGARATIDRGIDDDVGSACLRARVAHAKEGEVFAPPPALSVGGDDLAIDPTPFGRDADLVKTNVMECLAGEIPIGPGCARVLDDRVLVRSSGAPLLWAIAGEGEEVVAGLAANEGVNVLGLRPRRDIDLAVVTIDAAGNERKANLRATTTAPEGHVVINEVLANPLGPEPRQEWVELVNDGSEPVSLLGYQLLDDTGATSLPAFELLPGRFALVVNETFVEDDGVDAPPAPDAELLRVAHLGSHGLANDGETLRLVDAVGAEVSRFPAVPQRKGGMSAARTRPGVSDLSSSSFHIAKPTPGTMNPT